MQKHTPNLYYCTECRTVYAGHHNPGTDDEGHYTPPETCEVCSAGEFVEWEG